MNTKTARLALALALVAAVPARATLIQGIGSLPGASLLPIPAMNYVGTGPVRFGPAVWSSNDATSLFGSTTPFSFGNGVAGSAGQPIFRIDQDYLADYVTMTVTFDRPVKGVLARLFWSNTAASPFGAGSGNSTFFGAFDSSGALLYGQPGCFSNGAGEGNCYWQLNDNGALVNRFGRQLNPGPSYLGYSYDQPVIKSVTFSNRYIGVAQLYVAGGVPEPASWAMLLTGFGLVGGMARRRRVVAA